MSLTPVSEALQDPKLAEMVRRIVEALRPDLVYVFGSRARAENGPDRDYDPLVVVPDASLPGHKRDQEAQRALEGVGAPEGVIVLNRVEFERKLPVVSSRRPPSREKANSSISS